MRLALTNGNRLTVKRTLYKLGVCFYNCSSLKFCIKKLKIWPYFLNLKSEGFILACIGRYIFCTQLMKPFHWHQSQWPCDLDLYTKIAIWNFVAAGAFVFLQGFFKFRVLHCPLQCLIDKRRKWIYTVTFKSVKWPVDKSQYYGSDRLMNSRRNEWKSIVFTIESIDIPFRTKPFCYWPVFIKFTEFSKTLKQE